MKEKKHLVPALAESIKEGWKRPLLSDFQGITMTGEDVAKRVMRIHIMLHAADVHPGDKVALCARNSAEWAVAFLGALTFGAVVVPILHEFHPDNVEHLVNHSEAKIFFTEKGIMDNLDVARMPGLTGAVLIPEMKLDLSRSQQLTITMEGMDEAFHRVFPQGLKPSDLHPHDPDPDRLALINYTSGSTGNPKGVMITYRNLWSNIEFAIHNIPFFHPGDGMLSMLPLAHMYGLVFEFLFPLCKGCHITFLGRVPSPRVVLSAFAEVKPKLVITVPLVIEKIVKGQVFPALKKFPAKAMLAIPGLRNVVYAKVRAQLIDAFGGQLHQLILGGAAVSREVETFLRKIKFPFTVGYGMTECAPLVTYEWWGTQRPQSCGRLVKGMQARVASPDPANVPGVLSVKGDNVMQGYYKNPEATAETLDEDGWLNTGDICTIDRDGFIYLRGRDKNMILSSSGQNIYPEEIEVKVNNLPLVAESVVVDRNGKIVALVHPDYDGGRKQGLTDAEIEARVVEALPELNRQLPGYSKVSAFEIRREPFEKTPKQSIRRFLYK